MKFNVIADSEKVKPLVRENICPYCGEKTAIELGHAGGQFGPYIEKNGDLIFYHCNNHNCSHTNYYVGKVDYEKYGH
jgi:hypothetical protein